MKKKTKKQMLALFNLIYDLGKISDNSKKIILRLLNYTDGLTIPVCVSIPGEIGKETADAILSIITSVSGTNINLVLKTMDSDFIFFFLQDRKMTDDALIKEEGWYTIWITSETQKGNAKKIPMQIRNVMDAPFPKVFYYSEYKK